jgi:hypothetical protein
MGHRGARQVREMLAQHVVERPDSHAAIGQRLALGGGLLRQRRQFVDVVRAQLLARQHRHRERPDDLHHPEILRLVLHRLQGHRRQDQLVGRALVEQVPVRRRGQHLLRRQRAAHAAEVLDDHLLAERLRQGALHDPRNRVRQAARRVRDHQVHLLARVGLRQGGRASQAQAREQGQGAVVEGLAVHGFVSGGMLGVRVVSDLS